MFKLLIGQCNHITIQELDDILKIACNSQDIRSNKHDTNIAEAIAGKSLLELIFCYLLFHDIHLPNHRLEGTFCQNYEPLLSKLYQHLQISDLVYLVLEEEEARYFLQHREILLKILSLIYKREGFYCITDFIVPFVINNQEPDYKKILQELASQQNSQVQYQRFINPVWNGTNNTWYVVEVSALGKRALGNGSTEVEAQSKAAQKLLESPSENMNAFSNQFSLRCKKVWQVPPERERLLQKFNFKSHLFQLPTFLLDIVFLQNSFLDRESAATNLNNDTLSIMGSYVLKCSIDAYLLEHFDSICSFKSNNMIKMRGYWLSNNFVVSMAKSILVSHENLIRESQGDQEIINDDLWQRTFKRLLGAIFIHETSIGISDPFQTIQKVLEEYLTSNKIVTTNRAQQHIEADLIKCLISNLYKYEDTGEVQYDAVTSTQINETLKLLNLPSVIKLLEMSGFRSVDIFVQTLRMLAEQLTIYKSGDFIKSLLKINEYYESLSVLGAVHWLNECMAVVFSDKLSSNT